MKQTGEISGSAIQARHSSRFLEWIWVAWVAWLPFLTPMFTALFQAHPTMLQLIVTFSGTAIFVVIYVWTAWQLAKLLNGTMYSLDALNRLWWIPVALLLALDVVLTLLNGNNWLGLFIFSSALVGGLLRDKSRMAVVVILLVDVLAFLCALALADPLSNLVQGGITITATGLTTLGLSRAVMTARELQRAREEIARLAVSEERLRIARDLHDLLGHHLSLIALKMALGFFVIAWRFVKEPHWRWWAAYSVISGLLTIAFMHFYGMGLAQHSAYAGVFERLATNTDAVWSVLVLARLWAGTRLMRSNR